MRNHILTFIKLVVLNKQLIITNIISSLWNTIGVFLALNPMLIGFSYYGVYSALIIMASGLTILSLNEYYNERRRFLT